MGRFCVASNSYLVEEIGISGLLHERQRYLRSREICAEDDGAITTYDIETHVPQWTWKLENRKRRFYWEVKPCQRDYTYLEARKYSDLLVSSAQSVIQSLTYSLTTRSPKYEKLSVQERWGVRFFASWTLYKLFGVNLAMRTALWVEMTRVWFENI